MAKRQRRIGIGTEFPSSLNSLINAAFSLVKTDNSVIFVKLISVERTNITVENTRGGRVKLGPSAIRELIIDSHA